MPEHDDLAHQLVELYEKMSSWEHCVVRDQELTLPQMHTLEILGANGPLRMKELAQKMGVTTGTLTVLVDRLEGNGTVRRVPNPSDRRSYMVELTERGTGLYEEHDKLHAQLTSELVADMEPEEVATLARLIRKMNASF